jgi:arylsulfatase A-like enzyme
MRQIPIFLLATLLPFLGPAARSAEPPNVLLITADDLGNQLSCYGDERLKTPRLDALASQGVRFTRAYVTQSSCSSSRASLLTGLYPHQNGQYGLAHLGFSMHPGQENLPALLKAAGYRTGIIGKLHVEPAAEFPFDWRPIPRNRRTWPTIPPSPPSGSGLKRPSASGGNKRAIRCSTRLASSVGTGPPSAGKPPLRGSTADPIPTSPESRPASWSCSSE